MIIGDIYYMKNAISKIKNVLIKLSFYLPHKLPTGMIEFNVWADSIISAYGLPDNDSTKFALATMILHLESTAAYKPKRYFALTTLKSMSNQIAAGVMQDLKAKQAERVKQEEEEAKKASVSEVVS